MHPELIAAITALPIAGLAQQSEPLLAIVRNPDSSIIQPSKERAHVKVIPITGGPERAEHVGFNGRCRRVHVRFGMRASVAVTYTFVIPRRAVFEYCSDPVPAKSGGAGAMLRKLATCLEPNVARLGACYLEIWAGCLIG
jgi:hypothetical protein